MAQSSVTTELHYSTVSEWWGSVVFSGNLPTTEVYFTFDLDVVASHLHGSNYTEYQQFLYETVSRLRAKHWSFPKIANWLNENGYPTVRGKTFRSAHVHSIVRKKRVKDERLSKRYQQLFSIECTGQRKTLIE